MLSSTRIVFSLSRTCLKHRYGILMPHRALTMHTMTKNLYLCTSNPREIEVDRKNLKIKQVRENGKPIVLMLCLFYGKKSNINKYAELYTDKGLDVLVGQVSLYQFLVSINSLKKYCDDIARLLANNERDYKRIYIHSFSSANGVYGTVELLSKQNKEKYSNISERVIGHCWDSPANLSLAEDSIPISLFPTNKIMQTLVKGFFNLYLSFNSRLLPHYIDAIDKFQNNSMKAPALIFSSKIDSISTSDYAQHVFDHWSKNGVDVVHQCFEDSLHVRHYQQYPEEYLKCLHDHWKKVKLLEKE